MEDTELKDKFSQIIKELQDIKASNSEYDYDLTMATNYVRYCLDDVSEAVNGDRIMRISSNNKVRVYKTMEDAVKDMGGKCTAKLIRAAIRNGTKYLMSTWDYC